MDECAGLDVSKEATAFLREGFGRGEPASLVSKRTERRDRVSYLGPPKNYLGTIMERFGIDAGANFVDNPEAGGDSRARRA